VANENKFVSDLNLINLPIFTTSKKIKKTSEIEEIVLPEKNGINIKLVIRYSSEEKLTFFDRKVIANIEYLFCQKYDIQNIETAFNTEYSRQFDLFIKERKIKKEDLSEAEKQKIIINAINIVKQEFKLFLTLGMINEVIYDKTYAHSQIKKSLEKLGSTFIHQQSDYFVDGSKLEISSIPLIEYMYTETKNNYRNSVIISLNSFHIVNLIKKKFVVTDIKLLNSFKSPISGRLSELLRKSLYGSKSFKKDKVTYTYDYLCAYLQLEQRTSKSLIIQQLTQPLNELIEKKIIVNWIITKELFGFEISFYHSLNFYEIQYKALDTKTMIKVQKGLLDLSENENDEYVRLENEVLSFINSTNLPKDLNIDAFKTYYMTYLFLRKMECD